MAGAKGRFEDVARAAYPSLYAAAAALLGNRADAEDAVQETMLKACAAWDGFRGDSSVFTWMYRILVRVAAARRGVSADEVDAGTPEQATATGPEAAAQADDEKALLLQCLERLPRRRREIVTLFYLEGHTYAEVAAALDVSVETVRSALARARTDMREMLTGRLERGTRL